MPDMIESQRVISQGGLNTLNNFLTLSTENPGAAVKLQNFESSLTGGYRRINGFEKLSASFSAVGGASAEGAVLGVWVFYNSTSEEYEYIAARKNTSGATYSFWLFDAGTGWSAFTTGITHTSTGVSRVRAEQYHHDDVNRIIFVDGVNSAVVYDGTNWYRLRSVNSGGSGSPGGNQILDAPSIVTAFKDHIFLSGDASNPAIVCYSAPNDSLTWTAAAGSGQLITGYDVVQVKPFRDYNYIFGKNYIKKALADAEAGFVLQDVTNNLGCIARDTVLELGGQLIYLSNDGLRSVAGTDRIEDTELGLVSFQIQDFIEEIINTYDLDAISSVVIRNKTQFRMFFDDSSTAVASSTGLLGCIRSDNDGQRWEFSTLVGIRASCCWSGLVDGVEVVLHGDYDGIVYVQEEGNSFNGSNITAIYTTPYIDIGDTEIRKLMRTLNIFLKAEGSLTLNIAVKYDWGASTVHNPANYTGVINESVTYDSGETYDSGVTYGGLSRTIFKTNIQGSCFSVQYSFTTVGTSAPYTIHGFVHEFSGKGRQ